MQSRFFHSSLQEIQLNVKEIYSLQGELRESVVNKAKKTSRFDKERPKDIESSPTLAPTSFAAPQDASAPVSIPAQFEIAAKPVADEVRPNDQGVLNQSQTRFNTSRSPSRGSGFKIEQNTKSQSRTLPFWVVFLIWEISALLVLIFFIL